MTISVTEFTEIPGLDGVTVVRHYGDSPTEARHAHDSLCVGAVLSGRREIRFGGTSFTAGSGYVLVIPPGAVHSCPRAGECEYVMVSIPAPRLERFGLSGAVETGPVLDDPVLFGLIGRLADAATRPASQLERQAALMSMVLPLCTGGREAEQVARDPERVAVARRCLDERFAEDVPLLELARLAGCSPFRLNREFAATVGMPPHQYQTLQRVRRVKECIRQGCSLADSAVEAGFADQSHMARCFKKMMGLTPGKFAAGLAAQEPE